MDKKIAIVPFLFLFITTLYVTASPLEQTVLNTIAKRAVIGVFIFAISLAILSIYVFESPPTISQSPNATSENDPCKNIEFWRRQYGNQSVTAASTNMEWYNKVVRDEVLRKQSNKIQEFDRTRKLKEIVKLEEEVIGLQAKIKKLEFDCATKGKAAEVAEANTLALKKQSEGFCVEYDRLLKENEDLRKLVQSIDHRLSYSDIKKKL
ncbi:hypothetical protein ACHQM5_009152 [Ranunculus cassubicifolius]